MELAGHADYGLVEVAHILHHDREVVVAPYAAGQTFDFQVGEGVQRGFIRGADMRAVEEQRCSGHSP